jgi:hypothetical protein
VIFGTRKIFIRYRNTFTRRLIITEITNKKMSTSLLKDTQRIGEMIQLMNKWRMDLQERASNDDSEGIDGNICSEIRWINYTTAQMKKTLKTGDWKNMYLNCKPQTKMIYIPVAIIQSQNIKQDGLCNPI